MREEEMLNTLIVESRDHLQKIEPDLLELERLGAQAPEELVNRIFRAVHSIKGGFGFIGLTPVVDLSHAAEAVLARLRSGTITATPDLVDALLRAVDKLRVLIDDIPHAKAAAIDEPLRALSAFLPADGRTGETTATILKAEAHEAPAPQAQPDSLDAIVDGLRDELTRHGKMLYRIVLRDAQSLAKRARTWKELFAEWEHYGDVVATAPSRAQIDALPLAESTIDEVTAMFTTVLEPQLVVRALRIPQERVARVDLKPRAVAKVRDQGPAASAADAQPSADHVATDVHVEDVLWVKVALLNRLMNLAGELVLARNQILQKLGARFSECPEITTAIERAVDLMIEGRQGGPTKRGASLDDRAALRAMLAEAFSMTVAEVNGINGIAQNIDMVTTSLQESILQTRMQPISVLFGTFPRVVRDLARKLGKQIRVWQEGQDVELDKSIIELLSDPLTHLVRNSADHGIESPDQRARAGKSREGTIGLRAYQEGGKVIVEVHDDGRGIDLAAVRRTAVRQGMVDALEAESLSERELLAFIFAPGFSTAEEASDISGRGMGMDVVKTNIERLGGAIDIASEHGTGTVSTLRLPLTVAIVPSLIVSSEQRRFAIPQAALEEVVRVKGDEVAARIERLYAHEVLRLRDDLLPLVRLSRVLGISPTVVHPATGARESDRRRQWADRRGAAADPAPTEVPETDERRQAPSDRRTNPANAIKLAVLHLDDKRYGLVVDDVQDNEEIVVKPLPAYLKAAKCYSGTTIMGDGSVAMILDPNGIAEMAGLRFEEIDKHKSGRARQQDQKADSAEEELLLFSVGGPERVAVSLSAVARIEKRTLDEIEVVGAREFVKYTDSTLRLVRIEDYVDIRRPAETAESLFVLVPKNTTVPFGFRIASVADTVHAALTVDAGTMRGAGIRGTAIVDGHLIVVLDMPRLVGDVQTRIGNDGA